MKYWEVKTKDITVWERSLWDFDGIKTVDLLRDIQEAVASIPDDFRASASLRIDTDYDTGPTGFHIEFTRPKTPEEVAEDEAGRLASSRAELDRARRNYETAQRELEAASKA